MSSPANYTDIDHLVKRHTQQTHQSSTNSKEYEPPKRSIEAHQMVESVEQTGLDQDVKPYVDVHADKLELDPELKKAGLVVSDQSGIPSYLNIKLPISDDKVIQGLHAPVSSSLRWLATIGVYILSKVHIHLKTVRGKVIRVLQR